MKLVKDKVDQDIQKKWKKHKEEYLKKHSIEDMCYENGTAIAMLYKEVQRLNSLLITIINSDGKESDSNN